MAEEQNRLGVTGEEYPTAVRVGLHRPQNRWALNTIAIGVILAICGYAERALAVILISVLLAFILAPLVDGLMRLHLPRAVAAAIAVAILLALIGGVIYYSYNQAAIFVHDLPTYMHEIREDLTKFR